MIVYKWNYSVIVTLTDFNILQVSCMDLSLQLTIAVLKGMTQDYPVTRWYRIAGIHFIHFHTIHLSYHAVLVSNWNNVFYVT